MLNLVLFDVIVVSRNIIKSLTFAQKEKCQSPLKQQWDILPYCQDRQPRRATYLRLALVFVRFRNQSPHHNADLQVTFGRDVVPQYREKMLSFSATATKRCNNNDITCLPTILDFF